MNQITILMDHMDPGAVVAQTQRIKQFSDRYLQLKSTLIDQYPVEGAANLGEPD